MSDYFPEIYRAALRPFQLDLGSTAAAVDDIKGTVTRLAQDQAPLPANLDAANRKIDVMQATASRVQEELTSARVDINTFAGFTKARFDAIEKAYLAALSSASDDIVRRIQAGNPTTDVRINRDSAPLVRVLTQAQAVALDATPAERHDKGPYKGELKNDVALKELLESSIDSQKVLTDKHLLDRFQQAFRVFTSNELQHRADRYNEIDRLIHDIVASLNT